MLYRSVEHGLTVHVRIGKDKVYADVDLNSESYSYKIDMEDWKGESNELFTLLLKQRLIEDWDKIFHDTQDSPLVILKSISRAIDYGVQGGFDLFFGEHHVFRGKDSDYTNAKNFKIWYLGEIGKIANIQDDDWLYIVREALKDAEHRDFDPLSPPIIEDLVDQIKQNPVHTQFCDTIAEWLKVKGGQIYFVLQEDRIYVPKYVLQQIYRKYDISQKRIRQYVQNYLLQLEDAIEKAGKEKIQQRYWVFSYLRLYSYDNTIKSIFNDLIKCSEEDGGDE